MAIHRDDGLARGLRALKRLALHAPLAPDGFAALNQLDLDEAISMLDVFERGGVARRTPHGGLFVLTPLGLRLLAPDNPVGALVAQAVDPIDQLGHALGVTVTLDVRRGDAMLCCVMARGRLGPAPQLGEQTPLEASLAGRLQAACDASYASVMAIRRIGYAIEAVGASGSLALPILLGDRAIAILSAHFLRSWQPEPVGRLLPHMVMTARRLLDLAIGDGAGARERLH